MIAESQIDLRQMARAATDFLLAAQDAQGAWKDFLLPAGNSNVWVTGYVGEALTSLPAAEARKAALDGWRFLEGVKSSAGGWSYNPTVPCDADSTLWGLRLAEKVGCENSERALAAREFFESHVREAGGVATYASASPVRNFIGLPPLVTFRGWTQSHVCVTAAAAHLGTHRGRLQQYLLDRQSDDGRWAAYWWFDDEYATAEAVSALAGTEQTTADSHPRLASAVARGVDWARQRSGALSSATGNAPAFALAQSLRVLARSRRPGEVRDALEGGLRRLAEWQKPDGSWPSSARLRVPQPEAIVPAADGSWTLWTRMPPGVPTPESILKNTFNIFSLDHYGVFTTATVLRALWEILLSDGLAMRV
jgi:hypothetical protein